MDYLGRSSSHTRLSPARGKDTAKEQAKWTLNVRRIESFYCFWGGEDRMIERTLCQNLKEPLGAKSGPQLTAIKEAQSNNHEKLDSINNQKVLESRKEHSPANTLILFL